MDLDGPKTCASGTLLKTLEWKKWEPRNKKQRSDPPTSKTHNPNRIPLNRFYLDDHKRKNLPVVFLAKSCNSPHIRQTTRMRRLRNCRANFDNQSHRLYFAEFCRCTNYLLLEVPAISRLYIKVKLLHVGTARTIKNVCADVPAQRQFAEKPGTGSADLC